MPVDICIAAFQKAVAHIRASKDPQQQMGITYVNIQCDETRIARLPQPLLQAFCPELQLSRPYKIVFIESQYLESTRLITEWMTACSEAGRIIPFTHFKEQPYFKYALIKPAAKALKFEALVQELNRRCINLACRTQLHTEDVRAVYNLLPADVEGELSHREMASYSIYKSIKNNELKAKHAVEKLRKEIPALDHAIRSRMKAKGSESPKAKA